jgi:hypothetical protein
MDKEKIKAVKWIEDNANNMSDSMFKDAVLELIKNDCGCFECLKYELEWIKTGMEL